MKNIAIVTIRNEMKNMYYEELDRVFDGYINIIPYSLEIDHKYNTDKNYLRSAELVLLTNPNIYTSIKDMLNKDCKILNLEYAFLKNKINSLRAFPSKTKALVCFNNYEVSKEASKIITQMGITNIDLFTLNQENHDNLLEYDIAIVGENSSAVPTIINSIVSLGRRKLGFSTLMDVAISLDIMDTKLDNRIVEYTKEIAIPSVYLSDAYVNSSYASMQLQTVMDCIDDSIIILDNDLKIINYSRNLSKLFNLTENILYKGIGDVPEFKSIINFILSEKNIKDLLIDIKLNKSILLTVQKIKKNIDNGTYIVLIKDLTAIIKLENTLKKQLEKKGHVTKHDFSHIYTNSQIMDECIHKAKIIAAIDKTTLIIGESGTGKELFAQSIHSESVRKNFPFVSINCAALPSNLLESELYGYEEGTFTGGLKGGKLGLLEVTNNGTLFLDEIGDMALEAQAKLLRVIEEKEFMRLGGNEVISINVRIIAATNRNLRRLIDEGKFRLDLYYRLNTLMFTIPPLRKRKDDIKGLINHFIEKSDIQPVIICEEVFDFLVNHAWEGNVRELNNCIDYMICVSNGNIGMEHFPDYILEELDDYTDFDNNNSNNRIDDLFYQLNDQDQKIIRSLITIIGNFGGGRRSIYIKLKEKYEDLSEYKLRILIDLLVKENLIAVGSGRSGLTLTEKGRSFI